MKKGDRVKWNIREAGAMCHRGQTWGNNVHGVVVRVSRHELLEPWADVRWHAGPLSWSKRMNARHLIVLPGMVA